MKGDFNPPCAGNGLETACISLYPCLRMVKLDPAAVRHIGKLARLRLTEQEVEKFAPELSSILQYIDKLAEVNTDDVEPTSQVTGLSNVFREDILGSESISADDLLQSSPLPMIDHQIASPPAHG